LAKCLSEIKDKLCVFSEFVEAKLYCLFVCINDFNCNADGLIYS